VRKRKQHEPRTLALLLLLLQLLLLQLLLLQLLLQVVVVVARRPERRIRVWPCATLLVRVHAEFPLNAFSLTASVSFLYVLFYFAR
jgi:hypothetical protein